MTLLHPHIDESNIRLSISSPVAEEETSQGSRMMKYAQCVISELLRKDPIPSKHVVILHISLRSNQNETFQRRKQSFRLT